MKLYLNENLSNVEGGFNKNRLCRLKETGIQVYIQNRNGQLVVCNNTNNKNTSKRESCRRGKTEVNKRFKFCEQSWKGLSERQRECWTEICRKYNWFGRYDTAHDAWVGLCLQGLLGDILAKICRLNVTLTITEANEYYYEFNAKINSSSSFECCRELTKLYLTNGMLQWSKDKENWSDYIDITFNKKGEGYKIIPKEEIKNAFGNGVTYFRVNTMGLLSNIAYVNIPAECDYSAASYIYLKHKGARRMNFTSWAPASDIYNPEQLVKDKPQAVNIVVDGEAVTATLRVKKWFAVWYESNEYIQTENGIVNGIGVVYFDREFSLIGIGEVHIEESYQSVDARKSEYCCGIYI